MYSSPLINHKVKTPRDYTNRARDEIKRELNLQSNPSQGRHGPSPLKNDLTLSKTNSYDSIDSQASTDTSNIYQKKPKGLFSSLSRLKKNQGSLKSTNEDIQMTDVSDSLNPMPVPVPVTQLPPLHPVPSMASTNTQYSDYSYSSSAHSIRSNSTSKSSLFSHQNSLATQPTNISSIYIPIVPQHFSQQEQKTAVITLEQALPTTFNDMYAPELLADPGLLINGRPMFTRRDLLNWELNDIRSLLIVEKLKPEWNDQLPIIYSPQGFKMEYLPLDSDDETIINVLVKSDIYKEGKFDEAFRIQSAKYILHTARERHAQILKSSGFSTFYNNRFSKPEWRNIIENFLLNLAVEAQCRHDFKKACEELKISKRIQDTGLHGTPAALNGGKHSLLRKAILNDVSNSAGINKSTKSYKLTKEEKSQLWTDVQSKVYQRLGLNWTPDAIN